jgi:hypothetical protein
MPEYKSIERIRPVSVGYILKAYRLKETGASIPQVLLNVAQAISINLSLDPICYTDDKPPHKIELDEVSIRNWLAAIQEQDRRNTHRIPRLTDHPTDPKTLFCLDVSYGRTEGISIHLPESPLESLLALMEQVCLEFSAHVGYTFNYTMADLHGREGRRHELKVKQTSPSHLPQPVYQRVIYENVTDTLPPLLLGWEFDTLKVPNGVWWINYWSPLQIATIGLERIKEAPWARIVELANGGIVLAITEESFDVTNTTHMQKLGEIVEHLRLRELQEAHRVPSNP